MHEQKGNGLLGVVELGYSIHFNSFKTRSTTTTTTLIPWLVFALVGYWQQDYSDAPNNPCSRTEASAFTLTSNASHAHTIVLSPVALLATQCRGTIPAKWISHSLYAVSNISPSRGGGAYSPIKKLHLSDSFSHPIFMWEVIAQY